MSTRVLIGDCRVRLAELEPESVHCVVTSPPYWSLRDYGTASWEGGDPDCDHARPGRPRSERPNPTGSGIGNGGPSFDAQDFASRVYKDVCGKCGAVRVEPTIWGGDPGHQHDWESTGRTIEQGSKRKPTYPDGKPRNVETHKQFATKHDVVSATCSCGAWRGALGLEPTPELYVDHLVEVMREVKRVLRSDGTLWLNLGDSYANDTKWGGATGGKHADGLHGATSIGRSRVSTGLKAKDMVGIPWRVAFALQADGWWLRSDVIWAKPNSMPESVTDRPAKAHEYLFLLAKSDRYYYDGYAIKEPALVPPNSHTTRPKDTPDRGPREGGNGGLTEYAARARATKGSFDGKWGDVAFRAVETLRNKRTVWTIPTEPYAGAHFAVFPPALVEPCILAGTSSRGVCPVCGAQWKRVLGRAKAERDVEAQRAYYADRTGRTDGAVAGPSGLVDDVITTGWDPSCNHSGEPDDHEIIASPTGERVGDDPSFEVGRAGMARPRGFGEGQRLMYRWQQRAYARQLRESEHRAEMEAEAGAAFEHYIRTDRSGARPVPFGLLDAWLARGWVTPPLRASDSHLEPVPAVVLDPFGGSGTTAMVATLHGRDAILVELNPVDALLIEQRLTPTPKDGPKQLVGEEPLPLWGDV